MSNARYTLHVDTNDDNLMFCWRTHLNNNIPLTAYNIYEYYHSRSGIDLLSAGTSPARFLLRVASLSLLALVAVMRRPL